MQVVSSASRLVTGPSFSGSVQPRQPTGITVENAETRNANLGSIQEVRPDEEEKQHVRGDG